MADLYFVLFLAVFSSEGSPSVAAVWAEVSSAGVTEIPEVGLMVAVDSL